MHSNKLIINFTPTGVIPRKDMTPHVPTFPDEIIGPLSIKNPPTRFYLIEGLNVKMFSTR